MKKNIISGHLILLVITALISPAVLALEVDREVMPRIQLGGRVLATVDAPDLDSEPDADGQGRRIPSAFSACDARVCFWAACDELRGRSDPLVYAAGDRHSFPTEAQGARCTRCSDGHPSSCPSCQLSRH